ncbi:protein aardvark [Anaeramoeba ignava]|uniref:Protein aardvark n=1 Tax=Anaeramoeba ignava TaxID=1746090 RepID=A0A9Q0LTN2_ANAIG|nr:protein aardvark [Anaeramoeba ignava]
MENKEKEIEKEIEEYLKSFQKEKEKEISIQKLFKIIKQFPLNETIQQISFMIFKEKLDKFLKINDLENLKEQIIQIENEIETIITIMNIFPNNEVIQFIGCEILGILSVENERIETIIKSMNNFPNNQDIQFIGCASLANISFRK